MVPAGFFATRPTSGVSTTTGEGRRRCGSCQQTFQPHRCHRSIDHGRYGELFLALILGGPCGFTTIEILYALGLVALFLHEQMPLPYRYSTLPQDATHTVVHLVGRCWTRSQAVDATPPSWPWGHESEHPGSFTLGQFSPASRCTATWSMRSPPSQPRTPIGLSLSCGSRSQPTMAPRAAPSASSGGQCWVPGSSRCALCTRIQQALWHVTRQRGRGLGMPD